MYFPALVKKTIGTHSPIHLASRNGHYDIVKALIDKGMSGNLEVMHFFLFKHFYHRVLCARRLLYATEKARSKNSGTSDLCLEFTRAKMLCDVILSQ